MQLSRPFEDIKRALSLEWVCLVSEAPSDYLTPASPLSYPHSHILLIAYRTQHGEQAAYRECAEAPGRVALYDSTIRSQRHISYHSALYYISTRRGYRGIRSGIQQHRDV
jgi:hypothetical protein